MSTAVRPVPKSKAQLPPSEDKPLPHNLEYERAILGGILLDNAHFPVASRFVQPADFFLPQHRRIFGTLIDMSGDELDTATLVAALQDRAVLEEAGGAGYISQLTDGLQRVLPLERYAKEVSRMARLRKMLFLADYITERAFERDAEPETLYPLVAELELLSAPPQDAKKEVLALPDMPEDVLDTHLGDICRRRMPGFPIAYSWPAILAVAGALVPQSNARTNLFSCLVGDVATGKSHAARCAIGTMGLGSPALQDVLAGSAEGLLEAIADANGAHRLLFPDELGHLLTKAKIDLASFPFVLNSAFYQTRFQVRAARGKEITFNASLGIIGGIVEENFETHFGCATTGGLHDRFLFGLCPRPFTYNYRPHEGAPEDTQPCPVTIHPEVWEARDEWMRTIPGLSSRCAELAIRAATIAAAFGGRLTLYAKHLGPAKSLAEYQGRIRKLLKPNPGENSDARCANAILAALDKAAGWAFKRDIAKTIHSERFGPSVFERAIASLQAMGEVLVDPNKPVRMRRVNS